MRAGGLPAHSPRPAHGLAALASKDACARPRALAAACARARRAYLG